MYIITKTQRDYEKSFNKKLTLNAIADDELREASIRQRIRDIENIIFDEYWDELLSDKLQRCPTEYTGVHLDSFLAPSF
ncbi:MAG: hypothetical protein QNJ70_13645 [Xenococcaceae cyanobacterium MO_207.B15]|nr:hypothetical protein [Xenococcaceae cyanobacterium MO_207.B15]